jgi:hypothetical protein
MELQISTRQLQIIIEQSAEIGAMVALVSTGKLKPYLKKAEAFRLYGRKNIEHWIDQGLITPRKDGDQSACWRVDRLEAEALAKARLILQYL